MVLRTARRGYHGLHSAAVTVDPRRVHTDRLVAAVQLLAGVKLRRPTKVTDHAFRRWHERYDKSRAALLELLPKFELVSYDRREAAGIWEHDGVKLVVLSDGTVKTVLPLGASRKHRQSPKQRRERFEE